MRVLVNALSAESLSGKHVLYGHLRQLSQWTIDQHEFHVVANSTTYPDDRNFGPNVHWVQGAERQGWMRRSLWEWRELPRLIRSKGIQLYFTPSGTILPWSPVPQVSLAQNPWCLTPDVSKSASGTCKGMLQRAAYRRAQIAADLMVYNSSHMQQLYRQNAGGRREVRGVIAHQGLNNDVHVAASRALDLDRRRDLTIVCVSVMARWKNCEALLSVLKRLHDDQVPAKLRLIGNWPDRKYRSEIESAIERLGLEADVRIEGHVSKADLFEAYHAARVYCLLSRCESFAIPAVEAQAFGTPVVGSNTSAMLETGGLGGKFVNPDDVSGATQALKRLLTDDSYWKAMSLAAISNAQRFRWEHCSRPLMKMFSLETEIPVSPRVEFTDVERGAMGSANPRSMAKPGTLL